MTEAALSSLLEPLFRHEQSGSHSFAHACNRRRSFLGAGVLDRGKLEGRGSRYPLLLSIQSSDVSPLPHLLSQKILPSEYYTSHLLVSQADQRVLIDLVDKLMPRLSSHMEDLGVDLPAVTFAWFLSLYTDCLPVEVSFISHVWNLERFTIRLLLT